MDLQRHVLLFSGEYAELAEATHDLVVRSRTHVQLRSLLDEAAAVMKLELASFQSDELADYGDFEDILELAECHAKQQCPSTVIEMALLVTFQIAQSLMYVYSGAHV